MLIRKMKLPINIFSLVITIALSIIRSHSSGCSFALNGDLPQSQQPLYLQKRDNIYQIIHPRGDNLVLESDAEIYLACSGLLNYLLPPDEQVAWKDCSNFVEAKCVSGNMLLVRINDTPASERLDGTYSVEQLKCKRNITGDIRFEGGKCANNKGHYVEVGFEISGYNVFVPSFRTCLHKQSRSVIYAEESLDVTTGGHIFDSNQEFGISKIKYGYSSQFHEQEVNASPSFLKCETYDLIRGNMVPMKDFPYLPQKSATNYYINAVPQWQGINNGNWKSVENIVRLLNSRIPLEIYTGIYDILSYKDENNIDVNFKVYLGSDDRKIEVPKWTWKIILSRKDRTSGIAFVTLNDPFETNTTNIIKLCDDTGVCNEAGYQANVESFETFGKGYTYCCRVEDLKKVVPYVVQDVIVRNLLPSQDRLISKGFNYTK